MAASSSPVKVTFLKPVISLLVSTIAAFEAATVPAVIPSIASRSFSFISAEPITKLPAVIAPDAVRFLNEETSLFASTTTALLAAIVPFVIPSNFSRSASFMSADPIMKDPVAVTVPPIVALPLASKNTVFEAGKVQNIVLVPELQLTALFELELANIVVLANVVPEAVKVPIPTSKSVLLVQA